MTAANTGRRHWQHRGRVPVDGPAVQAAREAKGWTRTKLAAELGVCEKTLARYETGNRLPSRAMVLRMTLLLETNLGKLGVDLQALLPSSHTPPVRV